MDELNLVMLLKEGNQYAFTLIYKKYAGQAYALSYKYLRNQELAEDVVQNLFLKLWQKKDNLQTETPVNRFLFTVLRNDLLTIIRNSKSDIIVLEECLENLNHAGTDNDTDISNEKINLAHEMMKKLPPQRKKILMLKAAGKHTNQEIASLLSLSVNTIKCQYNNSLKQLREWTREAAL